MKQINIDEIISHKIVSYDIFDVNGFLLFRAGEIMTDQKLGLLKKQSAVFRKENDDEIITLDFFGNEDIEEDVTEVKRGKDLTKSINLVNKYSVISPEVQKCIKKEYSEAIKFFRGNDIKSSVKSFIKLKEYITEEVLSKIETASFLSQFKMLGDSENVHSVNTAIYSTILMYKLGFSEAKISEVTMGALLHDIGKLKLEEEVAVHSYNSSKNEKSKLMKLHPQIGYKIITEMTRFPEAVAKIALEHHETSDGLGYPAGLSNNAITFGSKVVNVCNFFDNITTLGAFQKINSVKDGMKVLLEIGSKKFSADVVYKFVNMLNYNDTNTFEEMGIL